MAVTVPGIFVFDHSFSLTKVTLSLTCVVFDWLENMENIFLSITAFTRKH